MAYIDERETFYIKRPNYEHAVDMIDKSCGFPVEVICGNCEWSGREDQAMEAGNILGIDGSRCPRCQSAELIDRDHMHELLTEGRMAEENCNE